MMKWGGKKSSSPSPSPSPSRSSSTSSIFHLPWFSKIKQARKNFVHGQAKGESDVGCEGMQMPASWKNCRFYGGGDDSDWRLSFGEENCEVERSRRGLKSVWYDSENENRELSFPSCHAWTTDGVAERGEALEFNQMVSNIRKLREFPSCEGAKGRENREFKGPRRSSEKELKLRNRNGKDLGEKKLDFEKQSDLVLQEKDIFELKPVKSTWATRAGNHRKPAFSSNCNFKTVGQDYMVKALNLDEEKENSEWEKLKEIKPNELMAKSENQRKSVYISTELQRKTTTKRSKVRAYSPRTACKIECKIKAFESKKRAKRKTEKKLSEKPAEESTAFDSFAVVKNSFDPQSDFKNSMIEMITVKGMKKAEELEELLACYLTLNADVYHDTIIKVFKQVWFELVEDHLAR